MNQEIDDFLFIVIDKIMVQLSSGVRRLNLTNMLTEEEFNLFNSINYSEIGPRLFHLMLISSTNEAERFYIENINTIEVVVYVVFSFCIILACLICIREIRDIRRRRRGRVHIEGDIEEGQNNQRNNDVTFVDVDIIIVDVREIDNMESIRTTTFGGGGGNNNSDVYNKLGKELLDKIKKYYHKKYSTEKEDIFGIKNINFDKIPSFNKYLIKRCSEFLTFVQELVKPKISQPNKTISGGLKKKRSYKRKSSYKRKKRSYKRKRSSKIKVL